MQRPRRPGRKASNADWERFHQDEYQWKMWKQQQEQGPRVLQHQDENVEVQVRADYSRDRESVTSDFIVIDRQNGGHTHAVYDDMGNEIVNHWRDR